MLMKRTLIASGLSTIGFVIAALWLLFGEQWFSRSAESEPLEVEVVEVGDTPAMLRISVTETGIVAINERDVERARLPFSQFSAESLSLSRDNDAVPFFVNSNDEDNETLYFYAEAITSTLEAPAVYLLKSEPGISMRERRAEPTEPGTEIGRRHIRWEENTTFLASANAQDSWLGPLIYAPGTIDITLDGILPTNGPATLRALLWSNNQAGENPDHHLAIDLNGVPISDQFWDGITNFDVFSSIPQGTLLSGENIVSLTAPGNTGAAGEAIYLDWIELEYDGELILRDAPLQFESSASTLRVRGATENALVFDVSDSAEPALLTDFQSDESGITFSSEELDSRFLIIEPNQAIRPNISVAPVWDQPLRDRIGAEYVAIVAGTRSFGEAVQPLIELRRDNGLDAIRIPLAQIYDEFSGGRQSPTAIRDFIRYTQENWRIQPRYVLLVGDASYDVNQFRDGENRNLLPTHLRYSPYAGWIADDGWFVESETGAAPSVAIGRFPIQNLVQLKTLVRKTIESENAGDASWRERTLLVADDETYFDVASDQLALSLADSGYYNQKLYMSQRETIRDAIIGALNQGVGILNYAGHGGIRVWGDERVLRVEDAATLKNRNRLPIFTTFTNLNGHFSHPEDTSLAEALLWADGGGIVAAVAPSGRSLVSQQTPLANAFYESLLVGDASMLGDALLALKTHALENPSLIDAASSYNLLGDPALRFHAPSVDSQ